MRVLLSDARPATREKRVRKPVVPVLPPKEIAAGGLRFGPAEPVKKATPLARAKKVAVKMDPALVGKSRALRDWWMEQANGRSLLAGNGKYDVSRAARLAPPNATPVPLLKAG